MVDEQRSNNYNNYNDVCMLIQVNYNNYYNIIQQRRNNNIHMLCENEPTY